MTITTTAKLDTQNAYGAGQTAKELLDLTDLWMSPKEREALEPDLKRIRNDLEQVLIRWRREHGGVPIKAEKMP